jgi:prepilin-type N-terminal cleavage/methylation domain-containing protein
MSRSACCHRQPRNYGMTLMELLVTLAITSIALSMAMSLYLFALRTLGAVGNYTQMDGKSQQAVDLMLREVRASNLVLACQTNGATVWLQLANTVVAPAVTNTFTWTPATGLLSWDKTGVATRTLLTGCDSWSFAFFIRSADSNGVFFPTTDPTACKLINMSWKCSRANIAKKMNTESIVTAEVVLRNKP